VAKVIGPGSSGAQNNWARWIWACKLWSTGWSTGIGLVNGSTAHDFIFLFFSFFSFFFFISLHTLTFNLFTHGQL
jgi:hypothetical protein